jgi:tRNA nucleotidyltransferase/poly(A) polymerase
VIDIAAMRGGGLTEDLQLRDFTINAMAMDIHQEPLKLIDPLGGAKDLKDKVLRACSPHAFEQDPVRILRAVRFAFELNFSLEANTKSWLKEAIPLLENPSVERLRDELWRIFAGKHPAAALRTLHVLGAFSILFPEVASLANVKQSTPHVYDAFIHTLTLIDKLDLIFTWLCYGKRPDSAQEESNLFLGMLDSVLGKYRPYFYAHFNNQGNMEHLKGRLFFAGLYHDVGKALTPEADENGEYHFFNHDQIGAKIAAEKASALHLSNEDIQAVNTIITHHIRPIYLFLSNQPPSRRAVYRFFRDAGNQGVDIILLSLADYLAAVDYTLNQKEWERMLLTANTLLEAWWEKREEQVQPPPLINGNQLMQALGLSPSKKVGELLEAIREAQAEGNIKTADEALALARSLLLNEKSDEGDLRRTANP